MRDLRLYIVAAGILFSIYILVKLNEREPLDWTPTYSRTDKIPYGTFIFYEQLRNILPGLNPVPTRKSSYEILTEEQVGPGNYLIVASSIQLNEYDFKKLGDYMRKGNKVLIATYQPGFFLSEELGLKINSENKSDDKVSHHFTNKSLRSARPLVLKDGISEQYFSKFDTLRATVLARNNRGNSTFLSYKFGKGELLLLASPQVFTNFNMVDSSGAEYTARVLSYLKPEGTLIWDEVWTLGKTSDAGMLDVLMNYPDLKWAYYIALFSLMLYALFEFKRRQRAIPVIDPPANLTTQFAETLGRLYYDRHDNKDLLLKKISYLREQMRSKFQFNGQSDGELYNRIAERGSMKRKEVEDFFNMLESYASMQTVGDDELIIVHRKIEQFKNKLD